LEHSSGVCAAAAYPLLLLLLPAPLLVMPFGCRNCDFLALLTPSLLPHHSKLQLLAAVMFGVLVGGLMLAVVLVVVL
jgi:hypothetical protein